jgi:molybdopterin-guanine dinucleotide biosynthesis protein A
VTSNDHHKHPKLAKPPFGKFGRNEWAILGSTCNNIQALAQQLIAHLSLHHRCAYVDATHVSPADPTALPNMLRYGAAMEYTAATDHDQFICMPTGGDFQRRVLLNDCDVVLVNGNHHAASAQVVMVDPAKVASLKRRIDQLTNVVLFIMMDEDNVVFDFLSMLPGGKDIPCISIQDVAGINRFFEQAMQKKIPLLNGLVLAGGQSRRMGRDKGAIEWHGIPQREYMANLLQPLCKQVFISCRAEQQYEIGNKNGILTDTFVDLGPFGALLSAFRAQPDHAWLVVACDLPLLNQHTLEYLLSVRCPHKIATTFRSPSHHLPEPLITIWEPKAYAVLLSFLAQGYSCPRKVLIHSDVHVVEAPMADALLNVNTPEELDGMRRRAEFEK